MFRKNTIFIKKCGDLETLKGAIYKFTRNWVFQHNKMNELINSLEEKLETNDIRNLTAGIYPEMLSLAKSDYELLNVEDNKIFGMEVILRNE